MGISFSQKVRARITIARSSLVLWGISLETSSRNRCPRGHWIQHFLAARKTPVGFFGPMECILMARKPTSFQLSKRQYTLSEYRYPVLRVLKP
jgi:hypothetical protein